ncbi:chorismate mutase [Bacillus testis]|uniref:chorismate mutase n=1 Tax=Bacillus testis TaxID=1622072 RepID=UPI00067F6C38|nr:chorismate mutase [Bacillus testis]
MTRGVRGATTVDRNDEIEVIGKTEELLLEMIAQNNIVAEDVCSVLISVTADLTAAFPARALRTIEGWTYVPVMCVREIEVPGSLTQCVRVMLHWNTDKKQREIRHIYQHGAVSLRPDLAEKHT